TVLLRDEDCRMMLLNQVNCRPNQLRFLPAVHLAINDEERGLIFNWLNLPYYQATKIGVAAGREGAVQTHNYLHPYERRKERSGTNTVPQLVVSELAFDVVDFDYPLRHVLRSKEVQTFWTAHFIAHELPI